MWGNERRYRVPQSGIEVGRLMAKAARRGATDSALVNLQATSSRCIWCAAWLTTIEKI